MLRTVLLAATFVAIVAAAQFAPTPATAQTVPPAKGCACTVPDRQARPTSTGAKARRRRKKDGMFKSEVPPPCARRAVVGKWQSAR